MSTKDLQDQSGDELIREFRRKQNGIGAGAEGTCKSGNFVYAVVLYPIPFRQRPRITLRNIQYWNSQSASVFKENRFGFIARATVIADGDSGFIFEWEAEI